MKKLIAITLATSAMLCFTGCSCNVETGPDRSAAWTDHGCDTVTKVVAIDGHKYVIMRGYKCGGIVHANSCDCLAK